MCVLVTLAIRLSRPPPKVLAIAISASRCRASALASTIKTESAFSGWSSRERGRSVHGGGHAKPAEVDPVPRSFRHLPRHHRPIAGNEDLGIREARAGEYVSGACLNIVAANPGRTGGCGSKAEHDETQG